MSANRGEGGHPRHAGARLQAPSLDALRGASLTVWLFDFELNLQEVLMVRPETARIANEPQPFAHVDWRRYNSNERSAGVSAAIANLAGLLPIRDRLPRMVATPYRSHCRLGIFERGAGSHGPDK